MSRILFAAKDIILDGTTHEQTIICRLCGWLSANEREEKNASDNKR